MNRKHCWVLVLSLSMILAPIVHRADEHDPFPVRSPEDLSPPIVGDPIHECARAVHVSGFRPGATVRVYANDVEEVGRTTPFLGFDDIPLRRSLNLGERITATQSVGSVVSLQSYDPVIVSRFPVKLTKPVVGPDLFGCGRIVPVSNLVPSVHVSVFKSGSTAPIGEDDATGSFQPVVTSSLNAGEDIFAVQTACPDIPSKKIASLPSDNVKVKPDPRPLPPPMLDPFVPGSDTVTANGLFVGAEVQIFDSGAGVGGGLATGSRNWTRVSPRLTSLSSPTARQKLCTLSDPSPPAHPTERLRPPIIVSPVCRGARYVTIRETVINASVVLFRNGVVAGSGGAVEGNLRLALTGGATWSEGDEVSAVQYIGTVVSPISNKIFAGCAPENVITQHNDNSRNGAYLVERQLRPSNVRPGTFGWRYTRHVEGDVLAQPLYMRSVRTASAGVKDLFFIATAKNWIYAFDVRDTNPNPAAGVVWQRQLDTSRPIQVNGGLNEEICPETTNGFVGITSTPVIDPDTHTMYVVSRQWTRRGAIDDGIDFLHAINLADGSERVPKRQIGGTTSGKTFNSRCQRNRPGLLLLNGVVYIAYGTFNCDNPCWRLDANGLKVLDSQGHPIVDQPYFGWVFGYRASDLTPAAIFCTSADGNQAGIWQSGNGLVGSPDGHIYFETGNDGATAVLGDSFVRLRVTPSFPGLALDGFFKPSNANTLRIGDTDLGSGGPMLLPGGRLIGGGKQGRYYVLDANTMQLTQNCDEPSGHCSSPSISRSSDGDGFQAFLNFYHNDSSHTACPDAPPAAGCNPSGPVLDPSGAVILGLTVGCFIDRSRYQNGELCGPNIHNGPIYWQGPNTFGLIYQMSEKDSLKAFRYDVATHRVSETPLLTATGPLGRPPDGMPGGFSSLSANGNRDGIVWTSFPTADGQWNNAPGRMVAFDATTLATLWNDTETVNFAKFNPPTIADGWVIRATFSDQVLVYSLILSRRPFPLGLSRRISIDEKYLNYGGARGVLGVPIGDETPIQDPAGGIFRNYRGSVFALHGNMLSVRVSVHTPHPTCSHPELGKATDVESSIYWSPTTGAQVVQGEIRNLWLKMDGPKGKLGYPIEDETMTPDGGGRTSRFQRGEIWWYPDKGPYVHTQRRTQ